MAFPIRNSGSMLNVYMGLRLRRSVLFKVMNTMNVKRQQEGAKG